MTTHQRAPRLFVERIEAKQLLRVLDGVPEGAILFEEGDETRENLPRAPPESPAVGVDPLAGVLGQHGTLVKGGCFLQRSLAPLQASVGGGLERDEIHDRAWVVTP